MSQQGSAGPRRSRSAGKKDQTSNSSRTPALPQGLPTGSRKEAIQAFREGKEEMQHGRNNHRRPQYICMECMSYGETRRHHYATHPKDKIININTKDDLDWEGCEQVYLEEGWLREDVYILLRRGIYHDQIVSWAKEMEGMRRELEENQRHIKELVRISQDIIKCNARLEQENVNLRVQAEMMDSCLGKRIVARIDERIGTGNTTQKGKDEVTNLSKCNYREDSLNN
jgi:hypothetical protein